VSGYLSGDPEQLGENGAKFSVAVNEKWTRDGEEQEHAEWYNCVVNGKQAESVLKYLTKGSFVTLRGRNRTRELDDGRRFVNLLCEKVDFGPKPQQQGGQSGGAPF
jgi:single-stranded DNA-binding protein